MDTLLLAWKRFLGRVLNRDRVFQNSNDVTVTSFTSQSQQNFVIMFEIFIWTTLLNLSKVESVM